MMNNASDLYQKKILVFPIKAVQWYLVAIIILYLFGPLGWPTQNKLFFYSFLIIAQPLLYYGYKSVVNSINNKLVILHPKCIRSVAAPLYQSKL